MSLWRRGKWAWADFTVNGTRYRVPLKDPRGQRIPYGNEPGSANYIKAIQAETRQREKAERGELGLPHRKFARLGFTEASERHLATRRLELKASSLAKERQLLVKLREYFKAKRLSQITSDDVLAYRECVPDRPAGREVRARERSVPPSSTRKSVACGES
jgi:hypothetical protein